MSMLRSISMYFIQEKFVLHLLISKIYPKLLIDGRSINMHGTKCISLWRTKCFVIKEKQNSKTYIKIQTNTKILWQLQTPGNWSLGPDKIEKITTTQIHNHDYNRNKGKHEQKLKMNANFWSSSSPFLTLLILHQWLPPNYKESPNSCL